MDSSRDLSRDFSRDIPRDASSNRTMSDISDFSALMSFPSSSNDCQDRRRRSLTPQPDQQQPITQYMSISQQHRAPFSPSRRRSRSLSPGPSPSLHPNPYHNSSPQPTAVIPPPSNPFNSYAGGGHTRFASPFAPLSPASSATLPPKPHPETHVEYSEHYTPDVTRFRTQFAASKSRQHRPNTVFGTVESSSSPSAPGRRSGVVRRRPSGEDLTRLSAGACPSASKARRRKSKSLEPDTRRGSLEDVPLWQPGERGVGALVEVFGHLAKGKLGSSSDGLRCSNSSKGERHMAWLTDVRRDFAFPW